MTRVFIAEPGATMAKASDWVISDGGAWIKQPNFTGSRVLPVSKCGCVMPSQTANALIQTNKQGSGEMGVARAEQASTPTSITTYNITFTTGAVAARIILGSKANTYQLINNIAAPPVTLVIGGTFGANSAQQFTDRAAFVGERVSRIQISAGSDVQYNSLQLSYFDTDPVNAKQKNINLSSLITDQSFRVIGELNENFVFLAHNGLDITIAPNSVVTFNFDIVAEGTTKLMNLID